MRAGDLDLDHLVFQREGREQMLPVPLSAACTMARPDPTLVLDGAGDARHPPMLRSSSGARTICAPARSRFVEILGQRADADSRGRFGH